jgi:GH35 family endo-1,4-beta-xylanase
VSWKRVLAAGGLIGAALLAWAGACALRPVSLDDARARIERLRTRHVELRLLDADGRPFGNAPVRARMTRHQFLFGANLYMFGRFDTPEENARYLELFAGLLNYATLPFYLRYYHPEPGSTRADEIEPQVAWARSLGIQLKGHPLVWHFPTIIPEWLPDDPVQVEALHQRRVQQIVERFRGRIRLWDVVNEPTTAWLYDNPIARWEREAGPVEVTLAALDWAAGADPNAVLLVNDFNLDPFPWAMLGLLQPRRAMALPFAPVRHHFLSYAGFLADLDARGGHFQAVGLQSHMHGGRWPLALVWRACERYAELGRPLHWTELTVLSGDEKLYIRPDDPEWKPEWPSTDAGEARQADYAEKLYTLLFSHPAVQAITWWDLSDRWAWMGAPAGLVRADLTPKPAYERLRRLIREDWWTEVSGETDAEGRFAFRGFCGDYVLEGAGAARPFTLDCGEPDGASVALRLVR